MTRSHEFFMQEALREANLAREKSEVPVGAVIVSDGEIVSRAHNEVETETDATCHAEVLAIRRAAKALNSWRLENCDLYVTLEPCPMCIGAVLLSRIRNLYFGAYDEKFGAVGSNFNLADAGLPRSVNVVGGILKAESSQILQDFFATKRSSS